MDSLSYQNNALRTNGPDYHKVGERVRGLESDLTFEKSFDLLHASLGMVTEAAEFQDMLKKHLYYGKELDKVNLKEEIGDILWYCSIALSALGTNFESVMKTNIDKLSARYPEKFTEHKAENRNLEVERGILEGGDYDGLTRL